MLKIKSDKINYLAAVVKLGPVSKHPNADKLQTVVCKGCSVITGLDAKEGDLYIFFPIESQINKEYLSFSDSFQDKELNADKEKKGFFVKTGRVRAIKLRGMVSEGYIAPVRSVEMWLKSMGKKIDFTKVEPDTNFDYIDDIEICRKYVVPVKNVSVRDPNKKKVKRESKLIENQFRLSLDAEHLKRNIHRLTPDSIITIGYKVHGSNMSMGRVLCKRPLTLIDKICKFFGANIQDRQYDLVYSSRNVIKNQYADKIHNSFYSEDIWGEMAKKYGHTLKDGVTIYGEVAGQMSTGSWVQSEYDYGLGENTLDLFVFRITYTNYSGDVFEFTTPQIIRYCQKMGLKTVPIFYYGKAREKYPELDLDNHWHENFLAHLIKEYTEKRCFMCRNDLPEEGVVVAVEGEIVEPFKLKSLAFLERETKLLDAGEINIEDEQAVENT